MKGFGYLAHRSLDDATEDAAVPLEPHRVSVKRAAAVLVMGAILACVHREISGTSEGSLVSVAVQYAGGTLHHLLSSLLNRTL